MACALRHRRRIVSTLLVLWMLALAWPVMAQVLPKPVDTSGDPWAMVCTSMGSAGATGTHPDTTGPMGPMGPLDHCPCCPHGGAPLAPPPASLAGFGVGPAGGHALPVLFLQGPRTLHIWRSALARAPPTLAAIANVLATA